jgi:hypothetical protein
MRRLISGSVITLAVMCLAFASIPVFGQDKPEAKAVSKDKIELRLSQLKKAREQALLNLQAFDVAIAENQNWLDEINGAEKLKPAETSKATQPDKVKMADKEVFAKTEPAAKDKAKQN